MGFPQLFAAEEIGWIIDAFETAIQTYGGGKEHNGTKRTMFGAPIERTEKLCTLLDDPRIVGILSSILGPDFNYCSGDGNYYSGEINCKVCGRLPVGTGRNGIAPLCASQGRVIALQSCYLW